MFQDEYKDEAGSVIGSDFYGATELLGLSDEQIVEKVVHNVQRCDPRALGAKVCGLLPSFTCTLSWPPDGLQCQHDCESQKQLSANQCGISSQPLLLSLADIGLTSRDISFCHQR